MTVHYAQTLDGRIAARDGSSRWISGEDALRFAHRLRAEHDAVMVGVGTVIADDPRLTVRLVDGPSPLRVVVDSALRIPLEAQLLADGAATLVATTARADRARLALVRSRGIEVLLVPADGAAHVDLRELLALLAARGVASVLIEGGPRLITAALREHLVDRLVVCIAPKILGTGVEAVGDLDALRLDDAMVLGHPVVTRCGDDLIVDGVLERVPLGV